VKAVNFGCVCWQIFQKVSLRGEHTKYSQLEFLWSRIPKFLAWQIPNFSLRGWAKDRQFVLLFILLAIPKSFAVR
jgi:hypothetical protein